MDYTLSPSSMVDLTAGEFLSATVSADTIYTATPTTYTFSLKTMNAVPSTGNMMLTVPVGVTVDT